MGIKDSFTGASLLVKVAFFVALAANFCNWIAFTTTGWVVVQVANDDDVHLGLWRSCSKRSIGCNLLDGYGNPAFGAVQAFAVFGFVCLNVGFLLLVLFMFWDSCKGNAEAGTASAVLLIASGVTWLLAVIIFAADYFDEFYDPNPAADLDFSFGLAIVGLLLAVVAGILVIVAGRGGGSVGSK